MTIRVIPRALGLLALLTSSGIVYAQPAAPLPEDARQVNFLAADEPAPLPTPGRVETSLPELPETTVRGQQPGLRPDAFPAQPLPDNTVVSPTLTEQPRSEVASSLTVITKQDIDRHQKYDVSSLLREVPGLDVVQQGGPGGLTSVFIRGGNSSYTKVLVDGIPLNDPSNANRAFDFSLLSVDQIQQIEVLRGPQSSLYGSDAMGGVINIITTRGEGPTTYRADFTGGSYGTANETFNVSGGTKQVYYSLGGSYFQTDGFSAADAIYGNTELDGSQRATLGGRVGWTPSSNLDIDYVFRWVNANAKTDNLDFADKSIPSDFTPNYVPYGGPAPYFNPWRQNQARMFINRIQARAMTMDGFWEHKGGFSFTDYDRFDTDPVLVYVPKEYQGQTRKIDYQSNFFLADWNTFSLGLDYTDETARSDIEPYYAQTDGGLWVQDQIRIGRWVSTAAFRWDDNKPAGEAETYRLTTLYRLPGFETAFHGSLGTGFRKPSLAENLFLYGNPNLRPEQSRGWDVGIEQPFGDDSRLTLDGTYFRNDYVDLIQYNFTAFMLENVGAAMTSGTELTARYRLDDQTTLIGNYTYTFSEDLTIGTPLRRRAPHKANLGVNRQVMNGRGNLFVNGTYVSPRLDSADGTLYLQEYWLVNAAFGYDLTPHIRLLARLDNLLNQQYEEVYGYGTAKLSFYGGASVHW